MTVLHYITLHYFALQFLANSSNCDMQPTNRLIERIGSVLAHVLNINWPHRMHGVQRYDLLPQL